MEQDKRLPALIDVNTGVSNDSVVVILVKKGSIVEKVIALFHVGIADDRKFSKMVNRFLFGPVRALINRPLRFVA